MLLQSTVTLAGRRETVAGTEPSCRRLAVEEVLRLELVPILEVMDISLVFQDEIRVCAVWTVACLVSEGQLEEGSLCSGIHG